MPYLQNATHEGFIFNEATKAEFLGNGVHAAMAMRYFVANLPTGQLDGNNQPIYANYNIGQAVGLYSSNGTGANLTEIYLDPVKLAITATQTELSNVTVWSANSILTQGRGDARYQSVGSYLTTANAASTYLPSANFSFSNLTGKPTTLSGYGITDGLTSATAAATYQTISGMSSYLTTSSAASTYLPSVNFTYSNITGKPTLATVATSGNYSDLSGTPNLSLYPTLAANNSFTGCNTFTGQINCNSTLALSGNLVTAPKIQAYSETANAPTISGGNLTLNLSLANVFGPVTLNANISNLTISNPPASGTAGSFTLLLKANGTAFTVTWPASVLWAGGTAPTLTSTANKTDVFSFVTTDGGTSYYGFKAGQNF